VGKVTIGDIRLAPPHFRYHQTEMLEWLAHFHRCPPNYFHRYGCNPERIASRGSVLADFGSQGRGQLYNASEKDLRTSRRTQVFEECSQLYVDELYADEINPPDHLFHVTCTGYSSPSAVQRLVQKKNWDSATTHCYHMGCYAALPATRLAEALVGNGLKRVDIVHTEFCTLHLNAEKLTPEQAVIQSLFADGSVRYSVRSDGPGLQVLAIGERLLPDTDALMSWKVGDYGAAMTLSRDVPDHLAQVVGPTVHELLHTHRLEIHDCLFAVHPGGPRIIDLILDQLRLTKSQVQHSVEILKNHGNMSSSTLPYIWKAIIDDDQIESQKPVVSIAFGPGLTFCWSLMRKQ